MEQSDKTKDAPIPKEDEVLRRLLNKPPAPFTPKAKKKRAKPASK